MFPVEAQTSTQLLALAVTSAYGGDGEQVANTTASRTVSLLNTGDWPIEYRINAGSWVVLDAQKGKTLSLDLSASQLHLRKGFTADVCSVLLEIEALTGDYVVANDVVAFGGGGGAAAFTDLTDVPAAYTDQGGRVVVVNPSEDGLATDPAELGHVFLQAGDSDDASVIGGTDGGHAFLQGGAGGGDANVYGGNDGGSVNIQAGPNGGSVNINGAVDGGPIELVAGDGDTDGGAVSVTAGAGGSGAGGDVTLTAGAGTTDGNIALNLEAGGTLKINAETAVATQSVLVAGVGTMTFTHGILTGFTPV